jgi:hypothetical protein
MEQAFEAVGAVGDNPDYVLSYLFDKYSIKF